jgi:N-acetylglucosaminyldiphosphoundecaprenol N-acetyl-beta-D-mannosaminyltransferase
MTEFPDSRVRVEILGSQVSAYCLSDVLLLLENQMSKSEGGYVCFTNVHTTVMGVNDASFRAITNASFLSLADGKPIYWVAKVKGHRQIRHIPGPDLMLDAIQRFPEVGHFFFGSTPAVLTALTERLRKDIPSIKISGAVSPPFRPLTEEERFEIIHKIRDSGAMFVWVGLGAPKQEQWMSTAWQSLRPALLFGVGAAFDFHAGMTPRAPKPLRSAGLEWLYRLYQEPSRLWRRYMVTNLQFIYFILRGYIQRMWNIVFSKNLHSL